MPLHHDVTRHEKDPEIKKFQTHKREKDISKSQFLSPLFALSLIRSRSQRFGHQSGRLKILTLTEIRVRIVFMRLVILAIFLFAAFFSLFVSRIGTANANNG